MTPQDFQPLNDSLVHAAWELSHQAGWEQTPGDWRRILRLSQGNLWVWMDEGAARASASLVTYGKDLGWIGMVLVDSAYRGLGLGKAAFARAVEEAQTRGVKCLGLDATAAGEGIYLQSGFQAVGEITRWRGFWNRVPAPYPTLKVGLKERLIALDREATGIDRRALLEDLATSGAIFLSLPGGYSVARASRTAFQVGPVLAQSPGDFAQLMAACGHFAEGRLLICDALHPQAPEVLHQHGLVPERVLKRMTLPHTPHALNGEQIWCGAGFEYG